MVLSGLEGHVLDVFWGIETIPRIAELDIKDQYIFTVSTEEDILHSLLEENDLAIVGGAWMGDEGKGKTVAALAKHPDIGFVARVNSGENAGHTVYGEDRRKYVFHLAPSAMLIPEKENFIGPNCVMDPISFMQTEMQQLIDGGIEYKNNLTVGNVHIVTPYHKLLDFLGRPNSSTLKGMSQVHTSKTMKRGPRLDDLFGPEDLLRDILKEDMFTHMTMIEKKMRERDLNWKTLRETAETQGLPEHIIGFIEAARGDTEIDYMIKLYQDQVVSNSLFPIRGNVTSTMQQMIAKGRKGLLEGPQSFFLSNAVEVNWSMGTSADTTIAGVLATSGLNPSLNVLGVNVHKTPPSKIGIGFNPSAYVKQNFFSAQGINSMAGLEGVCENYHIIQNLYMRSIHNNGIVEPIMYTDPRTDQSFAIGAAMAISSVKHFEERGATTGKPRICGLLDLVALHSVMMAQGPYLTISRLDGLDNDEQVGLVVGYVYYDPTSTKPINSNGKLYDNGYIVHVGDALPGASVLDHCYPIVKVRDGWKGDPIAANKNLDGVTELPSNLQGFLSDIQHFTGAEIISIGNGKNTGDLIYLKSEPINN